MTELDERVQVVPLNPDFGDLSVLDSQDAHERYLHSSSAWRKWSELAGLRS